MIAARLEFLLGRATDARLLAPRSGNKGGVEHLQFSGCVLPCFRLGLLHRTHAEALDAFGRIRNKAAYFDTPMVLGDGSTVWRSALREASKLVHRIDGKSFSRLQLT